MTIKVSEKGQPFRISTTFDMSGSTGLSIAFTAPDTGTDFTVTEASGSAVTAPAAATRLRIAYSHFLSDR